MARIRIEDIQKEAGSHNWSLLSTVYDNLDGELSFLCNEGHNLTTTWRKLRGKFECPICKQNQFKKPVKITSKHKDTIRILAIDQATRISGWAIFDNRQLVTFGTFSTGNAQDDEKMFKIRNWIISMVDTWSIDAIAFEGIQYQKNYGVTTFQALARLQGVIMETCYEINIPYEVCHTAKWRAHCDVKGKTRNDKKTSARSLIKKWFDISVSEDEADAICIGKYFSEIYKIKAPPRISASMKIESWE